VRSDTQAFIERLEPADKKSTLRLQAQIETIERRLSDDRKVLAAIGVGATDGGGGMERGALVVTDYGMHWAGGSNFNWPWEQIQGPRFREAGAGFIRRGSWWMEIETPDHALSFILNGCGKGNLDSLMREAVEQAQPRL
jgi:hypothetical protein